MPLPPAVAIPPVAGAFYAGAAAAGKHFMIHAAPLVDITTLSYSIIGYYLIRYVWRNKVPEWAKKDVSFQNLLKRRQRRSKQQSGGDDEDGLIEESLSASEKEELEMADLSSILDKLQALVRSVQLDDDHPTMLQQHAALLAYIQLAAQVKKHEEEKKSQQQPKPKPKPQQQQSQVVVLAGATDDKEQDGLPKDSPGGTKGDNSDEDDEEKKDEEQSELLVEEEEEWTSRDSLYETSRTSLATTHRPQNYDNYYSQYHDFAENPKEDSTLKTQLERALRLATYAYYDNPEILSDKLANEEDCSLLEHSLTSTRPGVVAYYLAVSSISQKQLILAIRGTSTLEDIVTDCCGRSVPLDDRPYYYDLDKGTKRNRTSNFLDPSRIEVQAAKPNQVCHYDNNNQAEEGVEIISFQREQIWVEQDETNNNNNKSNDILRGAGSNYHDHHLYCHEGIMVSAKRLVDTIQEHVEHWVLQRGYQLLITGHSLGSGVASLAAVLLRSRLPELTTTTTTQDVPSGGAAATEAAGGAATIGCRSLPIGGNPSPKMHVYCFAPPPVLDRDTALAATNYCTSVICNADMIPRCSMENLLIMLEILKGIWKHLQQQGWAPTGPNTTASFFKRIAKGTQTTEMLMTASELHRLMATAMKKVQLDTETKRMNVQNVKQQQEQQRQHDEMDHISTNNGSASIDNCESKVSSSSEKDDVETDSKIAEEYHPHLYIPGVVLLGYEPRRGSRPITTTTTTKTTTKTTEPADSDGTEEEEEDIQAEICQQHPMKWTVTDGTANVLRFLEIDASSRIFMDHTTTSYYSLFDMEYSF